MIDNPHALQYILAEMATHGQSIILNWGEDDNLWECSWITGEKRYTAFDSDPKQAALAAHQKATRAEIERANR